MSASSELQFHCEIRHHFRPCLALATGENERIPLLKEADAISSSDTIILNTSIWNNMEIFDDKEAFSAANLPSTFDGDDIKNLKALFLIHDDFFVFKPKNGEKVYDLVSLKYHLGVEITIAAIDCGFRVLMHPFYEKVLDTCDFGLGQLSPNNFININTFITRCHARKIEPNIDIFCFHY